MHLSKNENGKAFTKRRADGAFPVGFRAWKHFGWSSEKITSYHYNLSISSEMAARLRNKCCFSQLSFYCTCVRACMRACCDAYPSTKTISPCYPFLMNLCGTTAKEESEGKKKEGGGWIALHQRQSCSFFILTFLKASFLNY